MALPGGSIPLNRISLSSTIVPPDKFNHLSSITQPNRTTQSYRNYPTKQNKISSVNF